MEKRRPLRLIYCWISLLRLWAEFGGCSSASHSRSPQNQKQTPAKRIVSTSVILPLHGNVYPDGSYYASVSIGQPPKPFFLDLDTGSDLSWVQCDAPCQRCNEKAPHPPYKPNSNLVRCKDPFCASLHGPANLHCNAPDEQCDYEVKYTDYGSSLGVLIRDSFPIQFANGSLLNTVLAFGCGYDQQVVNANAHPITDGVLGLGNGTVSIVSQLSGLGLTRNVVGHCLRSGGGGYLFIGDDIVPSSGITWSPMSSSSMDKHYSSGPAELHFGAQATGVKELPIVFDSGSSYTYLNSQAYNAILSLIRQNLKPQLKVAPEDRTLPVCWKGNRRFKSIGDVKNYFKPVVLRFTDAKSIVLHIPPEAYLIVTQQGNVCLGILNGSEVGLKQLNVIGDISMQDKLVIYDNERQKIGWAAADCGRYPNADHDDNEGYSQPYAARLGILEEHCPAAFDYHQDL